MGKVKVWRGTAVKAVVCLAILLLQFDFNSCESSAVTLVSGTVNGSATLSPRNTRSPREIMWKKGRNKVAEWDSNDGVKSYPPFDGRVHLNSTSGELHISNLTPSDEGEYEVEIVPSSKHKPFRLTVFDPLPPPILGCNQSNESIVVQCEVPGNYSRHRNQLTYSWNCSLRQCGESTAPVLHLKKNDSLPEQVQCVVANSESNRTSSVNLSTCIPPDNSRHRYPLLGTLGLVVCIVVCGMCCWKRNGRA